MKNSITFFSCDIAGCGGTERVGLLIANELCRRGYDISVISYINDGDPFFECDSRIRRAVIFRNKWEKKLKRFDFYTKWRIRKYLKSFSTDILVDINSDMTRISGPAVAGTGVKHISWAHFNFEYCTVGDNEQENLKAVLKYADKLVVLTKEDMGNYLDKTSIRENQITQIYNPITFETQEHISHDQKKVLALGRISYEKGYDMLLKTWKLVEDKNDDWTLEIVNGGGDETELRDLIKVLGLKRAIISPRTNDVQSKYASAGLYVLSSRFEGFPMVLLEAAAMSVPMVAFNVHTGPKEFIIDGENGLLVEPNNIEELASKILILINNKEKRDDMSLKAFLSSRRFQMNCIIKEWIDLIDSL